MEKEIQSENHIVVFSDHKIRRVFHDNEWWFVISDVVAALTESSRSTGHIKDIRRRDPELAKGWGHIATPLSVETADEKQII